MFIYSSYAMDMKINESMKTLPRTNPIKHYKKPGGSYTLNLPVHWCEGNNVTHNEKVRFHEFVDHPQYLLIELTGDNAKE